MPMNSSLPPLAPAPPAAERRSWGRLLADLLVELVVLAVAAAGFVFSYNGLHAIALFGGVSSQLARYYPGLFDAVLVIACVTAVAVRNGRWWARLWAWLVIIVVLGIIGTANVLNATDYALRPGPTKAFVAAAPAVAILLAFSLLLTMLRHSRAQPAEPVTAESATARPDEPAAVQLVPASAGLAALPAAALATREGPETEAAATGTQAGAAPAPPIALTAGPAVRTEYAANYPVPQGSSGDVTLLPGPPEARHGAAEASLPTPPDGLPIMRRTPTEPSGIILPPTPVPPVSPPRAEPTAAEAPAAEPTAAEAPATGQAAAEQPVAEPAVAEQPVAEPAAEAPTAAAAAEAVPTAEPVPEAAGAEAEPAAAVPAPPTVPPTARTAAPPPPEAEPVRPAIRYAGSSAQDDWAGADAGQFAGLVYPAREEETAAPDRADAVGGGNGQPAAGWDTPELDDDASPFATAPFATVPRLNRVRSMPAPPEDDEED
jgi:Protein of unknown function (DUF2637)